MPHFESQFARFSARLGVLLVLLLAIQTSALASTPLPANQVASTAVSPIYTASKLCDYFSDEMQGYQFAGAANRDGIDYCTWHKPGGEPDKWVVEIFSYASQPAAQAQYDKAYTTLLPGAVIQVGATRFTFQATE